MPTQSYPYPDHEHPQYVTLAYLEAFEGRMINRIAEMEMRLERSMSEIRTDVAVIKGRLDGVGKVLGQIPNWKWLAATLFVIIGFQIAVAGLLMNTVNTQYASLTFAINQLASRLP